MKGKLYFVLLATLLLFLASCNKDKVVDEPFPSGEIKQQVVSKTLNADIPQTTYKEVCDTFNLDGFNNHSFDENLLLLRIYTDNNYHLWTYFIGSQTSNANADSKIEAAVDAKGIVRSFNPAQTIDSSGNWAEVNRTTFVNLVPYSYCPALGSLQATWVSSQYPNSNVNGYVGYRVKNKYGLFYGWLKINFVCTNTKVTINASSFARYDVPEHSILAGLTTQ